MTQPQPKGGLEPLEAGRGWMNPTLEPLALDTLMLDFWLQNWEKISFCCFKLPSIYQFDIVDTGHEYAHHPTVAWL